MISLLHKEDDTVLQAQLTKTATIRYFIPRLEQTSRVLLDWTPHMMRLRDIVVTK
jgi:hypothetical protein